MKAIILAAGVGRRLAKYSKSKPKCLLEIGGRSILQRQIDTFHRLGIHNIVVVTGYAHDKIDVKGVRYYVNKDYANTNMVYSLFCADNEISGDVIISYGDILFEDDVLRTLLNTPTREVQVVVDILWEEYYQARYERPYAEAESLIMDAEGRILEVGRRHAPLPDIQGQYVGLIKLSNAGCQAFVKMYESAKQQFSNKPWKRGRAFEKAYMTDFLQALIDEGVPVYAVPIKHGWLEFDTSSDYEMVLSGYANGELHRFCSLR